MHNVFFSSCALDVSLAVRGIIPLVVLLIFIAIIIGIADLHGNPPGQYRSHIVAHTLLLFRFNSPFRILNSSQCDPLFDGRQQITSRVPLNRNCLSELLLFLLQLGCRWRLQDWRGLDNGLGRSRGRWSRRRGRRRRRRRRRQR